MNISNSNSLLSGNLQGDRKIWGVGLIFLITGLIISLVIPYFLSLQINSDISATNSTESAFASAQNDSLPAIWILQGLGVFFAALGGTTILLKLKLQDNTKVEVIIGSIAALAYAIPAAVAYPALYWAFVNRPNPFFLTSDTVFPEESHLIGIIFTSTGIITILALFLMLRYYQKTGSNTFHISK